MTSTLQGDRELRATLDRLRLRGPLIARAMVSAGAGVLERAIRDEAPGRAKEEIGSSVDPGERTVARGKAGVGVGKARRSAGIAHLVVLGTGERFRRQIGGRYRYVRNPTRQQLSSGAMPANPFVRRAVVRTRSNALRAMHARGRQLIRSIAKGTNP